MQASQQTALAQPSTTLQVGIQLSNFNDKKNAASVPLKPLDAGILAEACGWLGIPFEKIFSPFSLEQLDENFTDIKVNDAEEKNREYKKTIITLFKPFDNKSILIPYQEYNVEERSFVDTCYAYGVMRMNFYKFLAKSDENCSFTSECAVKMKTLYYYIAYGKIPIFRSIHGNITDKDQDTYLIQYEAEEIKYEAKCIEYEAHIKKYDGDTEIRSQLNDLKKYYLEKFSNNNPSGKSSSLVKPKDILEGKNPMLLLARFNWTKEDEKIVFQPKLNNTKKLREMLQEERANNSIYQRIMQKFRKPKTAAGGSAPGPAIEDSKTKGAPPQHTTKSGKTL